MGKKPNWTPEEKEYFEKWYGKMPLPKLSKKLGRSMNALIVMRQRMGLGAFLEAGDMVSCNLVFKALFGTPNHSYQVKSWIKNHNFPVHYVRVKKNRFRMVRLSEMWEWLYDNRSFVSFAKFERRALGVEPAWVEPKRRADQRIAARKKTTPWTPEEDARLRTLLKMQRYTYRELSLMFGRSEGAIVRRCSTLKLRELPLRIGAHDGKWTPEDIKRLKSLIVDGKRYSEISDILDRSEKSCRGIAYRIWKTESLQKIWGLM